MAFFTGTARQQEGKNDGRMDEASHRYRIVITHITRKLVTVKEGEIEWPTWTVRSGHQWEVRNDVSQSKN